MCYLKFSKFSFDKIPYEISSFWKFSKIFIQTRQFSLKDLSSLRVCLDVLIENSIEIKILGNSNTSIEFLLFLNFDVCIKEFFF